MFLKKVPTIWLSIFPIYFKGSSWQNQTQPTHSDKIPFIDYYLPACHLFYPVYLKTWRVWMLCMNFSSNTNLHIHVKDCQFINDFSFYVHGLSSLFPWGKWLSTTLARTTRLRSSFDFMLWDRWTVTLNDLPYLDKLPFGILLCAMCYFCCYCISSHSSVIARFTLFLYMQTFFYMFILSMLHLASQSNDIISVWLKSAWSRLKYDVCLLGVAETATPNNCKRWWECVRGSHTTGIYAVTRSCYFAVQWSTNFFAITPYFTTGK